MTHRRRPLDVQRLVRQYNAGATITELGKLVDRTPSTVYLHLRREGVAFRGRRGVAHKPAVQVQDQILHFIRDYLLRCEVAPSVREITAAVGFKSERSTRYQLERLEAGGLIRRAPGVTRGITVLQGTEAQP